MSELDCSLLHWLHRASQAADDAFTRELASDSITPRQFAVLATIAQNEGMSQADVSDHTGIDRSTVADILRRLQAANLLVRRRRRTDARIYEVHLTEQGLAALREARLAAERTEKRLLGALPVISDCELIALLHTLVHSQGRTKPDPR